MKKILLTLALIASTISYAQNSTGNNNGHEWVDLGLSVKWATCNIGANTPGQNGQYFAWGETTKTQNHNQSNCKSMGLYIDEICNMSTYDTAKNLWGGNWRMPTMAEFQELLNECKWIWILDSNSSMGGYKVVGPNGNHIFLPASGYELDAEKEKRGTAGFYWSGTTEYGNTGDAYILQIAFVDEEIKEIDFVPRYFGFTIRPVIK